MNDIWGRPEPYIGITAKGISMEIANDIVGYGIPLSNWEEMEYPPNAHQSFVPMVGEYTCQ
jgi:hypothetical protein